MARGKAALVVADSDAERRLARAKRERNDPSPGEPRGPDKNIFAGQHHDSRGDDNRGWTANSLGLPNEDECPVQCLGVEGNLYHLIDSAGQFRSVTKSDLNGAGLQDLFALYPNYPMWMCPHVRETRKGSGKYYIDNFEEKHVRRMLFQACARRGLFSPSDKMRGRGMWTFRGGQAVYHSGDALWVYQDGVGLKEMETGLHEGHLYPRKPPLPAPWPGALDGTDALIKKLFETLQQWNWERPDIDPVLLIGWIAIAFLGGALDWRSAVMLVGDAGTGKSELQKNVQNIFGEALFHSADTTAAGIYQRMGQDARPVAVDELEAEADPRKTQAVIKLMRVAASGEDANRGGSDHHGISFKLFSAFLFSAINNPIQSSQDLSRAAILRLRPLDPNKAKPDQIDTEMTGRVILARMMKGWSQFEATRLRYMQALATGKHSGRGQKTYGTLLAAAELMLGSELAGELGIPVGADAIEWGTKLSADSLPEVEDAMPNWRKCLTYLMTKAVPHWRNGQRVTIGQALQDVITAEERQEGEYRHAHATRDLAGIGLGLLQPGDLQKKIEKARARAEHNGDHADAARLEALGILHKDARWVLIVPNYEVKLSEHFQGSDWPGAQGNGAWKDALRQGPPDVIITEKLINKHHVGGMQPRCTLVVLKAFHDVAED